VGPVRISADCVRHIGQTSQTASVRVDLANL
jgi:hypothetical protein